MLALPEPVAELAGEDSQRPQPRRVLVAPLLARAVRARLIFVLVTLVDAAGRVVEPALPALVEGEHPDPAQVAVGLSGALGIRALLIHEHELPHVLERRPPAADHRALP